MSATPVGLIAGKIIQAIANYAQLNEGQAVTEITAFAGTEIDAGDKAIDKAIPNNGVFSLLHGELTGFVDTLDAEAKADAATVVKNLFDRAITVLNGYATQLET